MISEVMGESLKVVLWIVAAALIGYLGVAAYIGIVTHLAAIVEMARAIPAKTAAFFGFMAFFLWTTICSQQVINATSRGAKQAWALMLYTAVWTLLCIHLLSQGFHL